MKVYTGTMYFKLTKDMTVLHVMMYLPSDQLEMLQPENTFHWHIIAYLSLWYLWNTDRYCLAIMMGVYTRPEPRRRWSNSATAALAVAAEVELESEPRLGEERLSGRPN